MQKIRPCLWFDNQAEEAVRFYASIFKDCRVIDTMRYGEAGPGMPGSVLTVTFALHGQEFIALNGGPMFKFTEAISFQVSCDTQKEIDHYWFKLSEGGDEKAKQCGWLKDKFGVSWQIVPKQLGELLGGSDRAGAARAMQAMLQMKKIVVADLEKAYAGK